MGRPKKHTTPYTGDTKQLESSFRDYLSCIADCFGTPYDDRDYDADHLRQQDSTSLRTVCDEFNISIPKARKLLITAGVYSTERSRLVADLAAQGKRAGEIMQLTGLSRSSVNSYLPYQGFFYKMEEVSRHTEDSRKYRERKKTVTELWEKIMKYNLDCEDGVYDADDMGEMENALWQCIIVYQNYPFHTSSGLPFSYTVKKRRDGEYSGELVISRKEGSKTVTRSSVMLAFHKVVEGIKVVETENDSVDYAGAPSKAFIPAEYKGPKAIGQIFGISYIYSLFWKWGLIRVPEKVGNRLCGKREDKAT